MEYIGIDVSKEKLDFAFMEGKHKVFSNSEGGIQQAIIWIEENVRMKEIQNTDIHIVVESTSWYHWLACIMLRNENFQVHLINPLITKKYQKSSIRDAKSDKVDAYRLAQIGKFESNLPLFFDSHESLGRKRQQSLLAKLERVKQELSQSLHDAMKSLEFIGISLDLSSLQHALDAIVLAIQTLKKMIENQADDFAKKLAQTPGISLFQASTLALAVSGRTFSSREKVVAFFGLDVRARQSGTWRGNSYISKRGNPYLRKILFQIGWSLKQHHPRFKKHYQKLRDDGKHYYTAILSTARKFLAYFFKLFLEFSYN